MMSLDRSDCIADLLIEKSASSNQGHDEAESLHGQAELPSAEVSPFHSPDGIVFDVVVWF